MNNGVLDAAVWCAGAFAKVAPPDATMAAATIAAAAVRWTLFKYLVLPVRRSAFDHATHRLRRRKARQTVRGAPDEIGNLAYSRALELYGVVD